MRKIFFATLPFLFALPASVSAYQLGNCSYSGTVGYVIENLDCELPPTNLSVSFSGSVQNADHSSLSGSYVPLTFQKDGVTYVSVETYISLLVWLFAFLLFSVGFYHLSVVSFKFGRNLFRKPS